MKITKYIFAGLLAAGAGLPLVSCSDYLNEDKNFKDLQTEDRIFSQKNYTEEWLAYCYYQLLGDNLEIGHRRTCLTNYSDDVVFLEGGGGGSIYRSWRLGNYQNLNIKGADGDGLAAAWSESYTGIRNASILINNIYKNKELSEAEKTDIKGQARFIRAYLYWLLLRKYGPVPLMPAEGTDYTKSYEELSYPRSTYDEVTDFIASEMLQAAKELPNSRSSIEITRPTKGAALAVRAKAYLYDASPLANGNKEEADFVNKDGTQLINQTYDESKWARAAAACRDVMELGKYSLHVSEKKDNGDAAYPATVEPPYNAEYSTKNFPDGWANIDPFESYRSTFDGDIPASENTELIFTRGTNNNDIEGGAQDDIWRHQIPATGGGYNCHGLTQKQCDAYDMADGTPFDRSTSPKKLTTSDNVSEHPYDHVSNNVWFEYCNREPRFYASVSFNGCRWAFASTTQPSNQNLQIFYYSGETDGRSNGSERWLLTGIGFMKFMNPYDASFDNGSVTPKVDPAIRYADILLMYAEALNELTTSYQIPSWDGSKTYTISRDIEEMRKGVKPVRMRAGVPDYDNATYANADLFRTKLKHERQVEFVGENQRYYDLRRWKDAPKEEGAQVYGCNVYMQKSNPAAFHTPVRVEYVQSAFARRQYFWPIEYSELKRDINLVQAPGWLTED